MARYRVKTKCFHGRLYEAGEEAEFEDGAAVPEHFALIEEPSLPKPDAESKGRKK